MPNPVPDRRKRTPGRSVQPMWLMSGLLVLFVAINLLNVALKQSPLDYSQFKQLLAQNRITEVVVGAEEVSGRYQNAEGKLVQFTTTRIDDPKLVEELEAQKVAFKGEPTNKWLTEILSWVLPFLLIVALWTFFIRRMGGAEGGIMSFA